MAAVENSGKRPVNWVAAGSAILAAGLAGLLLYLNGAAAKAAEQLERSKKEYSEMRDWRRKIEEVLRKNPRAGKTIESPDDLLAFLSAKARQAQIPLGSMTLSRNPDQKTGSWKEISYTISLRAPAKETPIQRNPVVDFVGMVENERPAIKSKSINFAFTGDNFASVMLTFSTFRNEP